MYSNVNKFYFFSQKETKESTYSIGRQNSKTERAFYPNQTRRKQIDIKKRDCPTCCQTIPFSRSFSFMPLLYAHSIAMRFGAARALRGNVMFKIPFLKEARTFSLSTSSGIWKLRLNEE